LKHKFKIANCNNQLVLIITFFLFVITNVNAQTVAYDSIKKQKYAKVDIHKTYERIIAKGYESIELFEYLATYYYDCNECEKSKMYFDLLFKKYNLSKISAKSIALYKTFYSNKQTNTSKSKKKIHRK
jgi:hypothetical protein